MNERRSNANGAIGWTPPTEHVCEKSVAVLAVLHNLSGNKSVLTPPQDRQVAVLGRWAVQPFDKLTTGEESGVGEEPRMKHRFARIAAVT